MTQQLQTPFQAPLSPALDFPLDSTAIEMHPFASNSLHASYQNGIASPFPLDYQELPTQFETTERVSFPTHPL
jgi:hypothetical protein